MSNGKAMCSARATCLFPEPRACERGGVDACELVSQGIVCNCAVCVRSASKLAGLLGEGGLVVTCGLCIVAIGMRKRVCVTFSLCSPLLLCMLLFFARPL